MQDPLADDVEAEVPGLDDAGVDRADRDLVDAVPVDRRGPGRRSCGWATSARSGSWPAKREAVQVVRLALVPVRGRHEVDQLSTTASTAVAAEHAARPSGSRADARTSGHVARRPRTGRAKRAPPASASVARVAPPRRLATLDDAAVMRRPASSVSTRPEPGSRQAGDGEREQRRARARPRSAARSGARGAAGRRRPARCGSPTSALDQRVRQPEEPERQQRRGDDGDRHLAGGDAAEQDQQLADTNSGDGGSPPSAPRLTPIAAAVGRARASDAASGAWAAAGVMPQQRHRGVEPERLGERVAGDVQRRRRRSPAGARSRSRAPARPCARGSSRPAAASTAARARGTAPRSPARPARSEEQRARRAAASSAGPSVASTRQATSTTVGSSAADSSALTGGGASLCASGSQLCTGAQPTFVASPAMISTNADSAPVGGQRRRAAAIARQSSAPSPSPSGPTARRAR